MPFFSYRCTACDTMFETLVRSGDTPACPQCGSAGLERLVSAAAVHGKTNAALSAARTQAAREGHFSNYSKSELRRK
ncbi:MAG TPA: zinc ribbon domain-containing protein [Magnetospirillum sp.]|jgi:putative FmdB family regulatory protein|nr:zinc ribbon domain-containing protein [Magnetospirillum sp.]